MNNIQEKKETLLPPPELLERYESISKGLSKELVGLVKKEQEHRHKLQEKYLLHFRCGQLFGSLFLLYVIFMIFDLARHGDFALAYLMAAMFGLLIVLILLQYKKDKISAIIRNSSKNLQNSNRRDENGRRDNSRRNYTQKKLIK